MSLGLKKTWPCCEKKYQNWLSANTDIYICMNFAFLMWLRFKTVISGLENRVNPSFEDRSIAFLGNVWYSHRDYTVSQPRKPLHELQILYNFTNE
jgi:hypothetical protein